MAETKSSTPSKIAVVWNRVPALVRGALVALLILGAGQLPPAIFLILGLRLTPTVPWFVVGTLTWLALFWMYLDGRWWPAATAERRRRNLRGRVPSFNVCLWTLVAGGLGMASVLSGALLTGLVADLPAAAHEAPFDLSPYPRWTALAFLLNIALVAGVVEEAAFRGYMLSIVEGRHGWVIGIASVAVLFYVVHRGHAYATLDFLPFFFAYSALHGVLVYFARSILPSVVLHTLGDLAILPVQYGLVPNPMGSSVSIHLVVLLGSGLAAGLGLWRLANITRAYRAGETAS